MRRGRLGRWVSGRRTGHRRTRLQGKSAAGSRDAAIARAGGKRLRPALLQLAGGPAPPAVPGASLDVERERAVRGVEALVGAGRQRTTETALHATPERSAWVVGLELGKFVADCSMA